MTQEAYLPDGNVAKLPDYSMESTQQEILKILQAMMKADTKTMKAYETIIEEAKNAAKDRDAAEKAMERQSKAMEDVSENTKDMADGLKKSGGIMSGIAGGASKAFGVLGAVVGTVGSQLLGLGKTINNLNSVGVGLDDQTGTTDQLIANMNYLGISTEAAAGIMQEYAGVVNTLGKTEFANIQKTFANLSESGLKFGLSLEQSAAVFAEDLEKRQQLGFLDRINQQQTAQRSAELYASQLKSTKLLGKSIEEIRGAGDNFIASNQQAQLSIMSLSKQFPNMADELTTAFAKTAGDFAAMGVDPNLANELMNMMVDPAAMLREDTQDMMIAFQQMGKGGNKLATELGNIQADMTSGDPARVKKAQERMAAMPNMLADFAAGLSPEELESFKMTLAAMPNSMAQGLVASLGPLNTAVKNRSKAENAVINDLARGAQAFENAKKTIMGTLQGGLTDVLGVFSPVAGAFADALTKETIHRNENNELLDKNGEVLRAQSDIVDKNGKVLVKQGEAIKDVTQLTDEQKEKLGKTSSIMEVFRNSVQAVRDSLKNGLGKYTDNLADLFRTKVIPKITEFTTSIMTFIDEIFSADDPLQVLKDKFSEIMDTQIKPAIGSMFAFLGESLISGIGSLFTSPTVLAAMAAGIAALWAKNKLMSAITGGGGSAMGGVGSAAGQAAGGGLAAAGKGIGQFGKGIGKGIGGIFKGLAAGIQAFANPAILLGATILAGSITIIGAGIAAAGALLGMSMPIIAEGFKSFEELDGDALKAAGLGMAAIGAGLAAFGAGSVMGAMGNIVGGILDGVNSMFGGTTPFDKMAEFGKMDFNAEKIKANAEAMVAFGKAMATAGAGQAAGGAGAIVSAIGDFFGGETPFEQMQRFGEMEFNHAAIMKNSETLQAFTNALASISAGSNVDLEEMTDDLDDVVENMIDFAEEQIDKSAVQNNVDAIKMLAAAYKAFDGINVDKLIAATNAIDKLNTMIAKSDNKTVEQVINYAGKMTTAQETPASPTPAKQEASADETAMAETKTAIAKTMSSGSTELNNQEVIQLLTAIRDSLELNARNIKRTGRATEDAIRESW